MCLLLTDKPASDTFGRRRSGATDWAPPLGAGHLGAWTIGHQNLTQISGARKRRPNVRRPNDTAPNRRRPNDGAQMGLPR